MAEGVAATFIVARNEETLIDGPSKRGVETRLWCGDRRDEETMVDPPACHCSNPQHRDYLGWQSGDASRNDLVDGPRQLSSLILRERKQFLDQEWIPAGALVESSDQFFVGSRSQDRNHLARSFIGIEPV